MALKNKIEITLTVLSEIGIKNTINHTNGLLNLFFIKTTVILIRSALVGLR